MNDLVIFKDIPSEIKMSGLFCCWKLTERGKVPFNPVTHKYCKSNDPRTFISYPTLINNLFNPNGEQVGGVGLGVFNGLSAIDIDHCVDEDGNFSDLAKDIIKYCDSYTEFSPSGKGVRIIFKTHTKIDKSVHYINNSKIGLEIYISNNTNKFVTLTGKKISGDHINELEIGSLLDKYMQKKDIKFDTLWNAKAPGSHSNESEMDMALCAKLAYYYKNDVSEIKRQFELSPYFQSKDIQHKKKWLEGDYAKNTIAKVTSSSIPAPTPPVSKKYMLNDTGNAQRFIDKFGKDVHYNFDNKKWMIWNGKFWETDVKDNIRYLVELLAEEMVAETFKLEDGVYKDELKKNIKRIYNVSGKDALLTEAQHISDTAILNADLDKNDMLVCSTDGTIDLTTNTINNHNRDDLISQSTSCGYSTEESTLFMKFLNDIFNNNTNLIKYVQKALGYSLTNKTREQCMWILYGDGNNGKSLILDVIHETLGSYAISCRPQVLTEQKNGNVNLEEIARLKGKRIVVVQEAKSGDKLDESLIKTLTSGNEKQVARFLYGNSFEFVMTGKIWMATNYVPKINGTDKGIWRRIKIVPITTDFTGREDKDLREKLLKEKDKILGWLVKGYQLYKEEGLTEPAEIKNAISTTKTEFDVVARWLDECCECNTNDFGFQKDLFQNFNAYCKSMKEFEISNNMFARNMNKKFKSKIYKGKTIYIGVKIRTDGKKIEKEIAFENTKINDDDI